MKHGGMLLIAVTAIVAAMSGSRASGQSAGIHFKGTFDAVVDCSEPLAVRDLTVHGIANGVINADKTGSADLTVIALFPDTIHFDARLGRWTTVPGGTGRMQITAHNRLRLVWSLPNNLLITDIAISRGGCRATLSTQLKHGQRQYSLYHGNSFYYCNKPRVVSTTCEVN
jgi:hypothetical protein